MSHSAGEAARCTDSRLMAVQYALLTKINAIEAVERAQPYPPVRDHPLHWERVHLASSARIARELARARGVDAELCAIACSLHDIGRIVTGKQAGHALAGEEPARKLLSELQLFSPEEIQQLVKAVAHHSDKDLVGSALDEIVKDADVIDCFEYGLPLSRPEQKRRYQMYRKQLEETPCASSDNAAGPDSVVASAEPAALGSPGFAKIDPQNPALLPSADTNGLSCCLTLLRILGADDAAIIDPRQVITAPWPRLKCQYGCGHYNKSLCCPPHTPDDRAMRSILDCYTTAILFHRTKMGDLTGIAQKAARQLFFDGYHKAMAFGSGFCRLCSECDLQRCRFPEQAIPSMEACGIDVFGTARACGFSIHTRFDRDESQNFFGLLLVE